MKRICLMFCLVSLTSATQHAEGNTGSRSQNVTGVVTWSTAKQNHMPTTRQDYPRQDADFPKSFSYTKLDSSGKDLPDNAASWSCVRDNLSGLVWEIKTPDNGLHGKSHTYTWYNPNSDINGGSEGTAGEPEDATCGNPATVAAGCDTEKFVSTVNAAGWCGKSDWRMPTVNELSSIANYGSSFPAISKNYFPDLIMPAGFWSASPYAANPNFAWIVIFDDGYVGSCVKSWAYYVRLVRGGI